MRKPLKYVAIIATLVMTCLAHAQARYNIVRLPGLVSGWSPTTAAINNKGEAVGSARSSIGSDHAVKWDSSTSPTCTDLGNLGTYGTSRAYGINDSGQVCGTGQLSSSDPYQPLIWNGTTITNLMPSGGYAGYAYGINNNGHVTGNVYTSGYTNRFPFIYNGTTSSNLISGGGYNNDQIVGINDADMVTGFQNSYPSCISLYDASGTRTLIDSYSSSSWAMSISHIGQVVFIYSGSGSWDQLRLWNPNVRNDTTGTTQTISFPSGNATTDQNGIHINAFGDIAGTFINNSTSDYVPFIRLRTNQTAIWEDLNTLIPSGTGWVLKGVNGINDKGQLIGYGRLTTGGTTVTAAFRLDPTSQPNR
jgi:hypothetical protein